MNKSYFAQIVFILIILYCVSSINVLMLAFGVLPYVPGVYLNPGVLIGFAILAFVLTLCVSTYHLSTMLRSKKRKSDK
jgi:hypothetical protein